MGDTRTEAEIKAFNLHVALTEALRGLEYLVDKTNSEPTFGEHPDIESARRALFENRPMADWEPPPAREHVGARS